MDIEFVSAIGLLILPFVFLFFVRQDARKWLPGVSSLPPSLVAVGTAVVFEIFVVFSNFVYSSVLFPTVIAGISYLAFRTFMRRKALRQGAGTTPYREPAWAAWLFWIFTVALALQFLVHIFTAFL